MGFTGININRAWKSDNQWFGEYTSHALEQTLRANGQRAAVLTQANQVVLNLITRFCAAFTKA
jgi:hypothetical protein